eukprot:CAMPEP_0179308452 /NCGR_PEP_ID=MMETSP0797-20121207/51155_1 /TAXON_ID=47934 /ORGANISM="Dinophysis acuminata, Strain DAEP01" /LENGTH=217 /DNA_ID=CAMNT_0021018149 /DNA_START=453 /DNA_END=1104 /DNA_ORIENTATION=+
MTGTAVEALHEVVRGALRVGVAVYHGGVVARHHQGAVDGVRQLCLGRRGKVRPRHAALLRTQGARRRRAVRGAAHALVPRLKGTPVGDALPGWVLQARGHSAREELVRVVRDRGAAMRRKAAFPLVEVGQVLGGHEARVEGVGGDAAAGLPAGEGPRVHRLHPEGQENVAVDDPGQLAVGPPGHRGQAVDGGAAPREPRLRAQGVAVDPGGGGVHHA